MMKADLATAIDLLKRVAPALNSHFLAGIEEREGGSARRQERLMKVGEELQADISNFLKAEAKSMHASLVLDAYDRLEAEDTSAHRQDLIQRKTEAHFKAKQTF
ncbi:hypothetical protein ABWH97_00010 [Nitratireductor sp. ac15]